MRIVSCMKMTSVRNKRLKSKPLFLHTYLQHAMTLTNPQQEPWLVSHLGLIIGSHIHHLRLPLCAGASCTKLCAGRGSSISTLPVGPEQPNPRPHPGTNPFPNLNPNPLGGSHAAPPRVLVALFQKKTPGGRKTRLHQ